MSHRPEGVKNNAIGGWRPGMNWRGIWPASPFWNITAAALKSLDVMIDVVHIDHNLHAVNEPLLRAVSSVVNGVLRHGFITDHRAMLSRFTQLARRTRSHLRLLYLHYGGSVCRRYCI